MANEATSEQGDFFACLVRDHARIEARIKALEQATGAGVEVDAAALGIIAETLGFFASPAYARTNPTTPRAASLAVSPSPRPSPHHQAPAGLPRTNAPSPSTLGTAATNRCRQEIHANG